jgi:hypothetical protein
LNPQQPPTPTWRSLAEREEAIARRLATLLVAAWHQHADDDT